MTLIIPMKFQEWIWQFLCYGCALLFIALAYFLPSTDLFMSILYLCFVALAICSVFMAQCFPSWVDTHIPFSVFKPSDRVKVYAGAGRWVYIIQDIDVTGYCKIGKTNKLEARMRVFNVKLPFQWQTLHVIACRDEHRAEIKLHQRYADKRVRGEWFALSQHDIDDLQSIIRM